MVSKLALWKSNCRSYRARLKQNALLRVIVATMPLKLKGFMAAESMAESGRSLRFSKIVYEKHSSLWSFQEGKGAKQICRMNCRRPRRDKKVQQCLRSKQRMASATCDGRASSSTRVRLAILHYSMVSVQVVRFSSGVPH